MSPTRSGAAAGAAGVAVGGVMGFTPAAASLAAAAA